MTGMIFEAILINPIYIFFKHCVQTTNIYNTPNVNNNCSYTSLIRKTITNNV